MPAPEFEWIEYDVVEVVGPRGVAAHVEVSIPDLRGHPRPADKAKILLETAAEVEHALLVQYLYAAFSLKESSEVTDPDQQNALKSG